MAGKTTSAAALPFIGVTEGFDLLNKVWSASGLPTPASMVQFATQLPQTLPSMVAPTLDIEELDKRIASLRAVEQWLNLNLSMLRTTVQSLEVQRNTIATLTSIGGTMLSTPAPAAPPMPAAPAPMATWPYAGGQVPPPAPAPVVAPAPAALPPKPVAKRRRRSPADEPAPAAAPMPLPLNPTAWWNSLQEQFTRIAATAAAQAPAAAKSAKAEATKSQSAKKAAGAKKPAPTAKAPERKKLQS